jgi:hypothetical protein
MAIEDWGNPILVHQGTTGTGSSDQRTVTALPNGGYVVVWRNGSVASVQVYDGLGRSVGTRKDIASTAGSPQLPDVAALEDGSFVVAWHSASRTIQTQKFSILGVPDGGIVTVAAGQTGHENSFPSVASDGDGVAVVWANNNTTSAEDSIWFQARGREPFQIMTGSGVTQPDVTELADGRHAVAWAVGTKIMVAIVDIDTNSFSILPGAFQPSSMGLNSLHHGLVQRRFRRELA